MSGLEGFGSSDITTPFYYGSVHDGFYRNDSFEQKLKKQYWKTKQTVIQKLGKDQDEFIVAGDTDIDTKLEKAYHLQSSCTELLQAIDKYIGRLRTVSIQESVMGGHLRTWSETEYSNAGEVMQNVGKLQENDSKSRMNMIPPLLRMRNEFSVFRNNAISDLNVSIQLLEKARTDYRAALLWMKDVSGKLQNPDYRGQLTRFREAQATVKETKKQFDRLKFDLGEKIAMVSASRCNLLSRSLPNYQKGVLDYSDNVANSFHKLLVDLRTHHHHQYKVRRVLEEIRDLENDEIPFSNELGQEGDVFSALSLPEETNRPLFGSSDDDPLLDIGKDETSGNEPPGEVSKPTDSTTSTDLKEQEEKLKENVGGPFRRVGDPFSFEEVAEQANVKDLVLGGVEAELQALQNELICPRNSTSFPTTSHQIGSDPVEETPGASDGSTENGKTQAERDDINHLLDLGIVTSDKVPLSSSHNTEEPSNQDQLVTEWDNFSAFMPGTRDNTKSPLSGWEKDFLPSDALTPILAPDLTPPSPQNLPEDTSAPEKSTTGGSAPVASVKDAPSEVPPLSVTSTESVVSSGVEYALDSDVDKLLGLVDDDDVAGSESSSSNELLSRELESLGISPVVSSNKDKYLLGKNSGVPNPSLGLNSINPSLFQMHSALPYVPSTAQMNNPLNGGSFRSPLTGSHGPPAFPTHGAMGMVMTPPKFGLVHPGAQATMDEAGQSTGVGGGRGVAKEEEKGTKWMNFFAHLDPLINEKV